MKLLAYAGFERTASYFHLAFTAHINPTSHLPSYHHRGSSPRRRIFDPYFSEFSERVAGRKAGARNAGREREREERERERSRAPVRGAGARGRHEKKPARVSREKRVFTVGAASSHAMRSPRTPPPKPGRSALRVPARSCRWQVAER